jgi:hypothetical protein
MTQPSHHGISSERESVSFSDAFTQAVRYWEPRRLLYNAALALVVVLCVAANWPTSRATFTMPTALTVFIFAVLANVAYCAAYVPDILLLRSTLRGTWTGLRWALLVVGILFAASITYFVATGIFDPQVQLEAPSL